MTANAKPPPDPPVWLGQVRLPGDRWKTVTKGAVALDVWEKTLDYPMGRSCERRVVRNGPASDAGG